MVEDYFLPASKSANSRFWSETRIIKLSKIGKSEFVHVIKFFLSVRNKFVN